MIKAIRWIIFLSALTAGQAFAAKVTNVNVEKRIITIDEGSETNFLKKSRVCFYDASNVKVGCSFIRTAKPKISFIHIKGDKLLAKITVGMQAKLEAGPGAPGIKALDPATTATDPVEKPKSYLKGLMLLPLAGPVSYQNLIYETPVNRQVDSMWSADSAVKTFGLGLEFGLGISSFQLAGGLRTRFFLPKKISSDYNDVDGDKTFEQYVETKAVGSSFGAWLDFYYWILDFGVVDFRLASGLDFDSSAVTLDAVQKSDIDATELTLYQGKSTLTALSLRLLPSLDFTFGPIAFSLGAVIYVPLSQSSKFSLDTQNDAFASANLNPDITAEQDLKESLKHEAKVGGELQLNAGFVF